MRDLFGIMNLLDHEEWGDEGEFYERYGGDTEVSTVEQIQTLQVSHVLWAPCFICGY